MSAEQLSQASPVIELTDVSWERSGTVLRRVSLRFSSGSFNVLVGDDGAGLLLRLAGLLDLPDSGEVALLGRPTASLPEEERAQLRGRHIGFVFSSPYLLPGLTVAENVAMPLFKVLALEAQEAAKRTTAALTYVGLQAQERQAVDDLCRYDQQRVALARAIAHAPVALVLDRADAGLSGHEATHLLEIVRRVRNESGVTVLATFASAAAPRRTDRVLAVEGGLVADTAAATSSAASIHFSES